MEKTILLTGARGLLGREIVKVLSVDPQIKLVATDKTDLDITRKESVNAAFERFKPAIVINCAAYTNVNRAESEKDLAFLVNAEGASNIAEASRETSAVIIHFSTDYVFSGGNKDGYKEDDADFGPLNVYGASKLLGEKKILQVAPKFYLVRTSWLFGIGGKCFPDTMIRLAEQQKELKVVCDQYGKPTYAGDLASAVRDIALKVSGENELPFGVYHIINDGVTNWYDFAREIIGQYGKLCNWPVEQYPKIVPVTSSEFPSPAKRPAFSALQNTKLPSLRSWQEALKDYLKSYQGTY